MDKWVVINSEGERCDAGCLRPWRHCRRASRQSARGRESFNRRRIAALYSQTGRQRSGAWRTLVLLDAGQSPLNDPLGLWRWVTEQHGGILTGP